MRKNIILFGCIATILLMVSTATALPVTSVSQETQNMSVTNVNNNMLRTIQAIKSMSNSEILNAVQGKISASNNDILSAIQKMKSMSNYEILDIVYKPQCIPLDYLIALIAYLIGIIFFTIFGWFWP